MKNALQFILLFGLLLLILTGCAPVYSASGNLPTEILPATQQSENTQSTIHEAPVLSIEIQSG